MTFTGSVISLITGFGSMRVMKKRLPISEITRCAVVWSRRPRIGLTSGSLNGRAATPFAATFRRGTESAPYPANATFRRGTESAPYPLSYVRTRTVRRARFARLNTPRGSGHVSRRP